MEGNAICKNCKHFIQYYTLLGVRLHESGRGHCGQKRSKAVWSDTKNACEKFDLRDEQAWCGEKLERGLGFAKDTCARMNCMITMLEFLLKEKQGK